MGGSGSVFTGKIPPWCIRLSPGPGKVCGKLIDVQCNGNGIVQSRQRGLNPAQVRGWLDVVVCLSLSKSQGQKIWWDKSVAELWAAQLPVLTLKLSHVFYMEANCFFRWFCLLFFCVLNTNFPPCGDGRQISIIWEENVMFPSLMENFP